MIAKAENDLKTARELLDRMGSVQWQWRNWLPKNGIIQLFAVPGIGKTTLALRVMGCITNRWSWPDGAPGFSQPGIVYWINSDGKFPGWKEKAERMGVDLDRVFFPPGVVSRSGDPRAPTLSDFEAILHGLDLCKDHFGRMPDLIVLDGLCAFHGQDENTSEVAQKVMAKLHELGDMAGAPLLLIHHQRKTNKLNAGAPAQEGARGSSAWAGAVDMQWHMQKRGTLIRLSVTKSNLAPEPRPLGFTLTDKGISFVGEIEEESDAATALEKADSFLNEILAEGPMPCQEIREKAKELGISKDTLYKAKDDLDISSTQTEGDSRRKHWSLPQIRALEDSPRGDKETHESDYLKQPSADCGYVSVDSVDSLPYTPHDSHDSHISVLSGDSGVCVPGPLEVVRDSSGGTAMVSVRSEETEALYIVSPVVILVRTGRCEALDRERL